MGVAQRQGLKIRRQFEPTRLAQDNLRLAYEMVAPVRRATIQSAKQDQVLKSAPIEPRRQEQAR